MATWTAERVGGADRPSTRVSGGASRSASNGHFEGLDGIRALAIAAVLVFHLNAPWLPGGFLGVDVFFVVSGFLITTLLVREHRRAGRIAFRAFWIRRARRLLPALIVCVTVSVLIARLITGELLVHAGRQVIGALTFSTNWAEITAGTSYFDQTAPQLFMNFWSLAVEEQFYLVWPLTTLLLLRLLPPRGRVAAGLGAAAVSTLAMGLLYVPGQDATRVYYGTDTHLMGLMLGAALAFAWARPDLAAPLRPSGWGRWGQALAAPAAGAVLLALMLLIDENDPLTFRGGILLASLATAVLLLGVLDRDPARSPTPVQRTTSSRVATWIGVRSYSIYLWHWPVILMVARDNPSAPGTADHLWTRAWCVLVTVALADLTYRFIETPFRRHGFRGVARRVGAALLHAPRRARQVVSATAATAGVSLAIVLLTAPDQSETARMLEANAHAAQAGAAKLAPAVSPRVPASGRATSTTGALQRPRATLTSTAGTAGTGGTATAAFAMPTGPEIDAYGDSMMVGSVYAMEYYFPGIRVDAKSNRRWSDGLNEVTARGAANRRAVILAFGTNAGVDAQAVGAVLDRLGPNRMVVLVNLMAPFARIDSDNATLAEVAKGRSNVIVADWAAAVRDHPEQLQADRIHPSLKGSHLFAKTVRQALATLSERHTGTPVALKDLPIP